VIKEQDKRITSRRKPWLMYLLTYVILLGLSVGQALLFKDLFYSGHVLAQYILINLGYWALISAIFCIVTTVQIKKAYDVPTRRLAEAARKVSAGDFSIYVEPMHKSENKNYMDIMIEDFNKMVKELGSTETMKNDFLSNITHEIKTPLAVIQNYTEALGKQNLSEEKRMEYIETIATATGKLSALVTNILKLSKLEHQEIAPTVESYDLCRQIADCALAIEPLLEDKEITLIADIDDKTIIFADASLLEIVWNNLLSNALKFTESGGCITIQQDYDEAFDRITISDTGCGIDAETLAHIFDKFYQGDTSRSQEGNGLGLALVKRAVELCGGSITVESEVGTGTAFTVTLPSKKSE